MNRRIIRAIHSLIIGLALAGCGVGSAPTATQRVPATASPALPPRPTSQTAAQASPAPATQAVPATATLPEPATEQPAATQELPATLVPPTSPPAAEPTAAAGPDWPEPTATPPFPEQQITAGSAGQLELLRTVGVGLAVDAAFSPDRRLLAVATSGGIAWYGLPELRHLRFDQVEGGAEQVRFADEQTIEIVRYVASDKDLIELRRVDNGTVIASRTEESYLPTWSQTVDSPAGDIQARFLPLDSVPTPGVTIVRLEDNATLYTDTETANLDFAADGASVALVTANGTVRIIDLLTNQRSEAALPGYSAAAFSPDGQMLVTAGSGLTLWDVASGEQTQREPLAFGSAFGPPGTRQRILFSPDGSELTVDGAYGMFEGEFRTGSAWKLGPAGAEFAGDTMIGGSGIMNYATYVGAISPAGRAGAFTSDGTTLEIHRDGALLHTLAWAEPIGGLAFSPDGALLAVADKAGAVRTVVVEDGSVGEPFGAAGGDLRLAFSPDGALLAVGGDQGTVALINISDGSASQTLQTGQAASAFAFSPDGTLLAAELSDDSVRVWEVATGRIASLIPASAAEGRLVFTSDNELLLAPGNAGVRVYRISDGALLNTLPVSVGPRAALDDYQQQVDVAIGPNRRMILILHDGYVQLWGVR